MTSPGREGLKSVPPNSSLRIPWQLLVQALNTDLTDSHSTPRRKENSLHSHTALPTTQRAEHYTHISSRTKMGNIPRATVFSFIFVLWVLSASARQHHHRRAHSRQDIQLKEEVYLDSRSKVKCLFCIVCIIVVHWHIFYTVFALKMGV